MNLSHNIKHAHIYAEKIWWRKHCGNPKLFLRKEKKVLIFLLLNVVILMVSRQEGGNLKSHKSFSRQKQSENNI